MIDDKQTKKQKFLEENSEHLMEKFIICFNSVTKKYKGSDLLLNEEIAPALLHTATYAAFNFLTYLAFHYAARGQEESFFEEFQDKFEFHCDLVLQQIEDNKDEEGGLIINDEKPILYN